MSLNFVTQKLKTQRLEEEQERRINVRFFLISYYYFLSYQTWKYITLKFMTKETLEGLKTWQNIVFLKLALVEFLILKINDVFIQKILQIFL